MNSYSQLLRQAAFEMRKFAQTAEAASFSSDWLEMLSARMEAASELGDAEVGRQMETISHCLIDSGPLEADSAPSFSAAMLAYRRTSQGKRRP